MSEYSDCVLFNDTGYCSYCMNPVRPGQPCEACGMTDAAYTPQPHHLPPGTILHDRYLIGRVLGEGGFGITYIGRDLRLDLRVAVKEYYPAEAVVRHSTDSLRVISRLGTGESQRYEQGLQRFLEEARILARMEKQPEIVTVRDFFEENATGYLVMEYVDGISLQDWVRQQGGRLTPQELLPVLEPLFKALGAMHEQGLLHRDISPDNLMLEHGAIRLVDFGCARPTGRNLTMTVSLKQGFAPIEQYQRKGQGPQTDVYALAATIYCCLTGQEPTPSLDRILEDELVPIQNFHTGLTPEQEQALMRGLAVQPRLRYQSMAEFHAGLYQAERVPETAAESPRRRRRWPWICIAAAAVLLLAVMSLLLFVPGGKQTNVPEEEDTVREDETDVPEEQDTVREEEAAFFAEEVSDLTPDRTGMLDPEYIDEIFRDAVTVSEETDLREALADEEVPAVVLDAGITLSPGALEITKPLRIRADAGLDGSGAISVSGGGWLCLEGHIGTRLVLRTLEGGSVSVTETGDLYLWDVWLETEEDLLLAAGSVCNLYGMAISDPAEAAGSRHMMILSPEDLFSEEASLRVDTEEELRQAMEEEGAGSVIVTAGSQIRLTGSFDQTRALLVEAGATVSLPDEDGSEGVWRVENTVLVNRGTLDAHVICENDADCCIVNEGIMKGQLVTGPEVFAVNLDIMDMELDYAGELVNLGEIRGNGQVSGEVINCGTWHLTEGTLTFADRVANDGLMELLSGTEMTVSSWMDNVDTLDLAEGATVICDGFIQCEDRASLTAETGACITGQGLLQLVAEMMECQVPEDSISCRILQDQENVEVCSVWNEDELRMAQEESPDAALLLESDILVSGDLTLTQPLFAANGSYVLSVEGTLTISGSDARITNGNVRAEHLEVTEGALLLPSDSLVVTGGLSVGEDALVVFSTWNNNIMIQESLVIRDGGRLVNATETNTLVLSDTEISLEGTGMLYSTSSLHMENCRAEVEEENGRLYVGGGFYMDENSTLTNDGLLQVSGSEAKLGGMILNLRWMELTARNTGIAGSIENDGTLTLGGDFVTISGTLENLGSVYLWDSVSVEVSEGGTLSGTDY